MPGLMDTILNLGLNDETFVGHAEKSWDERFAYDWCRRFEQMYGVVVIGDHAENDELLDPFEKIISDTKKSASMHNDTE